MNAQYQQATKFNAEVPPVLWPQPEYPWPTIHIDFTGPINRTTYLVVVDVFSKWSEVLSIVPPTTIKTPQLLTEIYRDRSPDVIVSDSSWQFISSQFQEFCRRLVTKYFRSSPYHPVEWPSRKVCRHV